MNGWVGIGGRLALRRAILVLAVACLWFSTIGCAAPSRYVATVRGRAINYDRGTGSGDSEARAYCEPACRFAVRPTERLMGCNIVDVDPALAQRLALDPEDEPNGQRMVLCKIQ